ncbi:hypothetical protein RB653_006176 [Dictyostelium firmibasis]|uniref:Uncharacterized protein n=1 Tax=Dictyostelium firmibasis TaxID=79012 RepID=A0AAN7UD05_9MYCE
MKTLVLLIFILLYNNQIVESWNQTDVKQFFNNFPFGIKSSSGIYYDTQLTTMNGTMYGFTKNGFVDFPENPGFKDSGFYLDQSVNMVEDKLGADGRPVYKNGNKPFYVKNNETGEQFLLAHNSSTFNDWFHANPCVNYPVNGSIFVTKNALQEIVFKPTNDSYPYDIGTQDNQLPYFYHPTFSLNFYLRVRPKSNRPSLLNIATNYESFFFINNEKQTGELIDLGGEGGLYYYQWTPSDSDSGKVFKIDIFIVMRTGFDGVLQINLRNSFDQCFCNNTDECSICNGNGDTCGCIYGPNKGCATAHTECSQCRYINDCANFNNTDPFCSIVKCSNNQSLSSTDSPLISDSSSIDEPFCVLEPIDCDDNNECTVDECSPTSGCKHTICPNSDISGRTEIKCVSGKCQTRKKSPCELIQCPSGKVCIENYQNVLNSTICLPIQCSYNNCDDGNNCTIDSCNFDSGFCEHSLCPNSYVNQITNQTIISICENNACVNKTLSHCDGFKCNHPNEICIEEKITLAPKCVHFDRGCLSCSDLGCQSPSTPDLKCKYIEMDNQKLRCKGAVGSCCPYLPTCY